MTKFDEAFAELMLEARSSDKISREQIVESYMGSGCYDFCKYIAEASPADLGDAKKPIKNVKDFLEYMKGLPYPMFEPKYKYYTNPANKAAVMSSGFIQNDGTFPKMAYSNMLTGLQQINAPKALAYAGSDAEWRQSPFLVKEPVLK